MILPKDLPEKGEPVLVKITKIMPYGAYCELVEYKIDAYLPIAEIAPGWIKNIHEFIKEGQKEAAVVIFIDPAKRAVDVSLKKITAKDKKDKANDYNLERRAENLFNQAIMASKKEAKKEEIKQKLAQQFKTYNEVINAVFEGKVQLPKGIDVSFKNALQEIVFKNIRPKVYSVVYTLEMRNYNTRQGIQHVKKMFAEIEKLGVDVLYMGAPHYELIAEGDSYPKAEAKIRDAQAILEKEKEITFEVKSAKAAA